MGCDITIHAEFFNDGKWEYYGEYYMTRSYHAFGLMADIYTPDDVTPVFKPKGIPYNPSPELKEIYDDEFNYAEDSWSYPQSFGVSYLNNKDIDKLNKQFEGCNLLDLIYKNHKRHMEGTDKLGFDEYDNYRIIFWFDN